jgi:hypothetical protein
LRRRKSHIPEYELRYYVIEICSAKVVCKNEPLQKLLTIFMFSPSDERTFSHTLTSLNTRWFIDLTLRSSTRLTSS